MITLDEAIERVRPFVEARPDYLAECECAYFDPEDKPLCIVGHAFAEELRAAGVGQGIMNGTAIDALIDARTVPNFDEEARNFLSVLQTLQDTSRTWGEAFAEALEAVGR